MRLLLIANDFPNPLIPTKGVFNLQLANALAIKHDVRVISPVSWLDQWSSRSSGVKMAQHRKTQLDGLEVHYPLYLYPPKILRSRYGLFYWRSIRAIVDEMAAARPIDAIVSYWVHPDGEGAVRAGQKLGVPAMVIVGGSDVLLLTRDPARRAAIIDVLQKIDAVVTVNQHLKTAVENLGVEPAKVHAWSQGIDPAIFYPGDRAQARATLKLDSAPVPVLLWVGRMVQVKGLEILLEACGLLREMGRDFRLYLVGDGELRESLQRICQDRQISDKVIFAGSRQPEQLGDWYRAADLFVMSSWSEGLPNVLRESLACGTPFVASDVGGIAEIACKGNRLFPAGDARAMANAIVASLQEDRRGPPDPRPPTWQQAADALVEILRATGNPSR